MVKKPDLDNCVKFVLDCLSRGLFWQDDCQVVGIYASKYYRQNPCTYVSITRLPYVESNSKWKEWGDVSVPTKEGGETFDDMACEIQE